MSNIQFKILWVVFGLFLLTSCLNNNLVKQGKVHDGFMNTYTNDSLRISVDFYGNSFFQKPLKKTKIRKELAKYGLKVPKNMLFFAKNKWTDSSIIVGTHDSSFDSTDFTKNQSDHKSIYYAKQHLYPQFLQSTVVVPLANQHYLKVNNFQLFSDHLDRPVPSFAEIEKESTRYIFSSLMCGENYKPQFRKTPLEIANEAFWLDSTGNYLLPVIKLEEMKVDKNMQSFHGDMLKTHQSFIGKKVSYNLSSAPTSTEKHQISIDSLVSLAAQHQVVMFNENHINTNARILVALVLKKMFDKGFNTLALEALADDESINKTGYATLENGFYVREPHMANMIRLAKKIGYKVIDYENQDDEKDREIGQAENLYNKTIAKNKNDKVIVLAGGGHIDELKDERGKLYMAYHFNKISGINPLTINQLAFMYETPESKIEVIDKTIDDKKNDLYLANNLSTNQVFMGDDLSYCDVKIPINILGLNDDAKNLLQLYIKDEWLKDKLAVPILIRPIENITNTFIKIPVGNYFCVIKNQFGQVVSSKNITLTPTCKFE